MNPRFDSIVSWLVETINTRRVPFDVHITGLFPKHTPWVDRYLFFYVNWASFYQVFYEKGVLLTINNEKGIIVISPLEGKTFKKIE